MFQQSVDNPPAPPSQQALFQKISAHWPFVAAIAVLLVFSMLTLFRHERFLPAVAAGHYWKPVFADEFNGNSLDSSRWVTCYDWYDAVYKGCTNHGNHELEWYTKGQVSVHDGYAELTAKPQATRGWNGSREQLYPYTSGMISTGRDTPDSQPKWSAQYGYYEARMKVDGGKGVWPAFWLLPIDRSWPPEIDIMELLGHEPTHVRMTYHWPGPGDNPIKDETIFTGGDFTKGWHVYSVAWAPGQIDWYIDGKRRKHVASEHVPDKPMELIINLAIGGMLPGDPDSTTPFPAKAQVDYVRAYRMTKQ